MVEYKTIITVIYYIIYALYIVSLMIGWSNMCIGVDESLWIMTGLFVTLLAIVCVCYNLYLEGYEIYGLSGMQIIIVAIFVSGLIVLVSLSQWLNNELIWEGIKKSMPKKYRSLGYLYGKNSEDISMQLGITDGYIFPPFSHRTLEEMWEILMGNPRIVKSVISKIMGAELKDSADVNYNLLWYLCIAENPLGSHLTKGERKYLTTLNNTELEGLLGKHYDGARDRASLLFAILSGTYVPEFQMSHRYQQIKSYPSNVVYNLAFNQNKIIDHENGTYSLYPPHVYLSQQIESPLEFLITNLSSDNYNDIIERLGIICPGYNNRLSEMTGEEIIQYLQGELSLYNNVLTRPEGLTQPPPITTMEAGNIMNILSYYTNAELVNAYEPRAKFTSRNDLLRQIYNDVTGLPQWSFTHMHCTNDNTMNIITAEQHGDTDKNNLEDPTLSFGIHKNYRCYQASELEASFREYDGVFSFLVPDWVNEEPAGDSDPRTIARREFPLDSIQQLQNLLKHPPEGYDVTSLANKVKIGLDAFKSAQVQTFHIKRTYGSFNQQQKEIANMYIAWMFMYSMWMRFWKGPGYPWPLTKVNVHRERERAQNYRSSPEERDEHIFIQEGVRTAIIETFENDPILAGWINSLPTIYYDFSTAEATCASYPIKETLDKIALGTYCMGFGSDTILKTSCYYIIHILDFNLGPPFDNFINTMLKPILDIEYQVIISQIPSIHSTNTPRSRVLNSRLNSLQQPIQIQQSFDPSDYQNNTHVD